MVGIVLFCAAARALADRKTPSDGVSIDVVITPDQPAFRAVHLARGQLVRLSYLGPGGVLSLLTHDGYAIRFGFSDDDPMRWYAPPGDARGFFAFGDSRETAVEIVAVEDTDVVFTGTYVDNCGVIRAGLLTTHSGGRSCFLSTDLASTVRVSGSANGSSVHISTPIGTTTYKAAKDPLEVRPFNLVSIDDDRSVSIEFLGGNPDYKFDDVTQVTTRGIVGKGRRWDFEEVAPDIVSPNRKAASKSFLLALVTIATTLTLVAVACTWISCRAFCRKGAVTGGSQSDQLFDQRPDLSDGNVSDEKTSESDRQPRQPMEYASPYETL
jgi:hypothetical protein